MTKTQGKSELFFQLIGTTLKFITDGPQAHLQKRKLAFCTVDTTFTTKARYHVLLKAFSMLQMAKYILSICSENIPCVYSKYTLSLLSSIHR